MGRGIRRIGTFECVLYRNVQCLCVCVCVCVASNGASMLNSLWSAGVDCFDAGRVSVFTLSVDCGYWIYWKETDWREAIVLAKPAF